jgi:hypothetical protein
MASSDVDNAGAAAGSSPEWDRLELGIRRLLDDHARWKQRAQDAEARVAEMTTMLAEVSRGGLDPDELSARVERLEALNRELVARLERARGSVGSILSRLELIEEDR